MKSHPLAPVFAMALLLAILMWLCSSCEKPHKYVVLPCELGDTTIVAESNTTYIGRCDSVTYKTIELYEGYIHPSGDYKWTAKGWLALRPFFRLSEDSTRLIQIK